MQSHLAHTPGALAHINLCQHNPRIRQCALIEDPLQHPHLLHLITGPTNIYVLSILHKDVAEELSYTKPHN